jgi:putative nucleotidyltransferase with HDIG domain
MSLPVHLPLTSEAAGIQNPKPPLEPQALVHLTQSSKDVFQGCVALALSATRATTALVSLHCPSRQMLEVVAAAGHLADQAVGRALRPGEALAWRVYTGAESLLVSQTLDCQDAHFVSGQPQPGTYLGVPLTDPDGQIFGVLSVDITDSAETLGESDVQALTLLGQATGVAHARLLALEQAQASARRFERLARLSADLEVIEGPDEIASMALQTLTELSGFSVGAVFGVEFPHDRPAASGEQGGALVALRVLAGEAQSGDFDRGAVTAPHSPTGILEQVIRDNATVVIPEYQNWPHRRPSVHGQVQTALATPLRSQGKVVGVIGLAHFQQTREISPELVTMLEMIAARIDRAVERAASTDRLRLLRESALRAVGRVLELRDDETYGHTDRVTTLAGRLGQALGLDEEHLQHLRWGAYLHDVGKVAVRDELLRKPGKLTDEERAAMQTHVVVGDEMLRDEAFVPASVREVVRHHHERWDGNGYPDGLAARAIPLLARVFSVVDVYDALISERPYKRAWPHEEALTEIVRCAGTQFDPWVVQAFAELL